MWEVPDLVSVQADVLLAVAATMHRLSDHVSPEGVQLQLHVEVLPVRELYALGTFGTRNACCR